MNISESKTFTAAGNNANDCTIDVTVTWYSSNTYIGTIKALNDTAGNFTALHAGRTEIYAVNGSISSNETCEVRVTVNAQMATGYVTDGAGNATSGNSTTIVSINDPTVNGTINITEIGDPLNSTDDRENKTGLGTGVELIKGMNITVDPSIAEALANDTDGASWVHIMVEYNESQLGDIDENTLYIYRFESGTGWVKLVEGSPSYCIANGRNVTVNYVWVNVTNCGIFGLGGSPPAPPTPTRRGGGGGTYPPGWFATPTPTVTTTPSPTITPAEALVLEEPAETETSVTTPTIPSTETRAAKPPARKGIPGFEVVFMVVALLAAAYLALRRNH